MRERNDLHDDYNAAWRDALDSRTELQRVPLAQVVGGVWGAGEKEDERDGR